MNIHCQIIKKGLEFDSITGSYLVRMYSLCSMLSEASQMFNKLLIQTVYAWDAVIAAHVKFGCNTRAIELYFEMRASGVHPDGHVFVTILQACVALSPYTLNILHAQIIEHGLESNMFVCNALICAQVKCREFKDAYRAFNRISTPDIVTWSTLIAGLIQNGHCEEALYTFRQMELDGLNQDKASFMHILKACLGVSALKHGEEIHARLIKQGLESDIQVGNTLLKMYSDCETLSSVLRLFERFQLRDVVTWSALLCAFVQHGHGYEALECFHRMKTIGIQPDSVTHLIVLKACSLTAALNEGRDIHVYLLKDGSESNEFVCSALIDMYAKCGCLEAAFITFTRSSKQNLVCWNALIACFTLNGEYTLALQYYNDMQIQGLKPDHATFIVVLSACSHGGFVQKGLGFFEAMEREHDIIPKFEHFNIMVDLLGRAGHFDDAIVWLKTMPFQPNIIGWTSLLNNCRTYTNVELGEECFSQIVEVDSHNSAAYVLLSSLYMHAGMEQESAYIEVQRKSLNAWKLPGKAYIELDGIVHEFIVGATNHPQYDKINVELRKLTVDMKRNGYVPHLDLVLGATSDEDKK